MSRFARTIIVALLALAVLPLGAAVYLVDAMMATSGRVASGEAQLRREALERARQAYTELFKVKKAQLREAADRLIAQAAALSSEERVALFKTQLANDPALKHARIDGGRPSGTGSPSAQGSPVFDQASPRQFPDEEWRELTIREGALELTYVTPRAPFAAFDALSELEASEAGLALLHDRLQSIFRGVFLAAFVAVVLLVLALGLVLARGLSRRVSALAEATRKVGQGDLSARVAVEGKDELTDLSRAFNEMVAELAESRDRINYLQKISAWQEVARRLAHEIKNPLTPIQLAVQQLRDSYRGDDHGYAKLLGDSAEIVEEEIGSLRRLVEDFSAFAKLPRVETAPVDAAALVEDFLRGYSSFEGKARFIAPTAPIELSADRMLLRRALFNLVQNALEAGAANVTITVERRDGEAAILVEDDGPGLPPDLGARVFDPYVTTKEHGTGLGLAIVKKIALEHGGDVVVSSRTGGGARFELFVPTSRGK